MIADNNEYLASASNTLCDLYAEENIRERCRDREEYYARIRNMQNAIAQKDADLKQKDADLKEKDATIQQLLSKLAEYEAKQND